MMIHKKAKSFLLSIGYLITFVLLLSMLSQFKLLFPSRFERFTYGFIGLISALITTWIFLKFEKKSFKDIGLFWKNNTVKKFLVGLFIGIIIAALMTYSQLIISGLNISLSKGYNFTSFLMWSSALIPLALMEEIAFRSYPFINLDKIFGFRVTQFIIAILFAIYHILNGWPITIAFIGPGILALVFGLSAKISDGISQPTGIHYGLNLFLAAIGAQKGIEGIWVIDFSEEASKSIIQQNETVGIAIHIFLLIIFIILTELYIRNKKRSKEFTIN